MKRYTFSIEIHSQEHPVSDKKTRNKILASLQDIMDHIIDPSNCFIDEQGYILGEDDTNLPHVRIFDRENQNQIPF